MNIITRAIRNIIKKDIEVFDDLNATIIIRGRQTDVPTYEAEVTCFRLDISFNIVAKRSDISVGDFRKQAYEELIKAINIKLIPIGKKAGKINLDNVLKPYVVNAERAYLESVANKDISL